VRGAIRLLALTLGCSPMGLQGDTDSWRDTSSPDDDTAEPAIGDIDPATLPAGDAPCREPVLVRVESVVDGDTVRVSRSGGATETIRILGVDTPEIGYSGDPDECWAQQARSFTTATVDGALVWLTFDAECTDAYARTLAYVHTGTEEEDFFDWRLLREGHARVLVIEPNSTFRTLFQSAQAAAATEELGLWGACR